MSLHLKENFRADLGLATEPVTGVVPRPGNRSGPLPEADERSLGPRPQAGVFASADFAESPQALFGSLITIQPLRSESGQAGAIKDRRTGTYAAANVRCGRGLGRSRDSSRKRRGLSGRGSASQFANQLCRLGRYGAGSAGTRSRTNANNSTRSGIGWDYLKSRF